MLELEQLTEEIQEHYGLLNEIKLITQENSTVKLIDIQVDCDVSNEYLVNVLQLIIEKLPEYLFYEELELNPEFKLSRT